MESSGNSSRLPYSAERFVKHPDVIETRALIDESMEHFVNELHEQVNPGIDQGILFEPLSMNPVTIMRSPKLFEVGTAIAGTHLDTDSDFTTYDTVLNSAIPLRGSALGQQIGRVQKGKTTTSGLVATSALNSEHTVLGFPVFSPRDDRRAVGMAQVAISRETALSLAHAGSPRHSRSNWAHYGISKAGVLWQPYSEMIGEQITELHALHQQLQPHEPYLEALEIDTPKVAPNSIALSFDLTNSTERALAKNDGVFTHFIGAWKRNVEQIIAYHGLTNDTELIGDFGDGYSIIFWLDKSLNPYNQDDIDTFKDSVIAPFTHQVQAMSSELATQYKDDLGHLEFHTAETPTFSYMNTPTDMNSRGLWETARQLKKL